MVLEMKSCIQLCALLEFHSTLSVRLFAENQNTGTRQSDVSQESCLVIDAARQTQACTETICKEHLVKGGNLAIALYAENQIMNPRQRGATWQVR